MRSGKCALMNFFSLFGLPEKFEIDSLKLNDAYKKLAQITHPDKFASGSSNEKLLAVQKNAQVNDGYQVLKKPLSRAEHLLWLRGIELQHEQTTMQDPVFLMQQMEWREQLADIDSAASPLDALSTLDSELKESIKEQISALAIMLEKQDDDSNQLAATQIRKLKFLEKLRVEIERKEDELHEF